MATKESFEHKLSIERSWEYQGVDSKQDYGEQIEHNAWRDPSYISCEISKW